MSADIPLIVFAKAPEPGAVKTRLQPPCSAEQAAQIATILLRATLQKVVTHWPDKVILAVWPDQEHEIIQQCAVEFSIQLVQQQAGDLGEKMHGALDQFGYPAAIIGADAPQVSAEDLGAAYRHLQKQNHVLGPSSDGGYYFIGLTDSTPSLFQDIEWGTDKVLQPTLARAKFHLLDELDDVDRWVDVVAQQSIIPSLGDYLRQQRLIDFA